MPKFSILTSIHINHELKQRQLVRCEKSVQSQSVYDYEWIIVNDGSTLDCPVMAKGSRVIDIPHLERIVALSKAMEEATGEWFVFLDSDDELASHYLRAVSQMIEKYPDYKMFNFGSIHIGRTYKTTIRGPFTPAEEEVGHEIFGGGNIVNGTFVVHRSLYDSLGGFPPTGEIKDPSGKRDFLYMSNPWDFSIAAQLEFPEIEQYFQVPVEEKGRKVAKELGNPWGNDFYLFYKYTRKYHSKPFDIPLYIVHHEGKQEDGAHYVE